MKFLKYSLLSIAFIAAWFAPAALIGMKSVETIDFFERNYQFQKKRADYLFDGANNHGLLDICLGKDGKVAVLFKEDCAL